MIGDKIKERRLELGLTQSQLSNLTGIKNNTISNYENNISSPNEANLFKLFSALQCDANYLFEWEENEDINISYKEKKHIKKYRTLDEYGTKAVDSLLDIEYERCMKARAATEKSATELIYGGSDVIAADKGGTENIGKSDVKGTASEILYPDK